MNTPFVLVLRGGWLVAGAASGDHLVFLQSHCWLFSDFSCSCDGLFSFTRHWQHVCLSTLCPRASSDTKTAHFPMSEHSLEVLGVIIISFFEGHLYPVGIEASPQMLQPPIFQWTILGGFWNFLRGLNRIYCFLLYHIDLCNTHLILILILWSSLTVPSLLIFVIILPRPPPKIPSNWSLP